MTEIEYQCLSCGSKNYRIQDRANSPDQKEVRCDDCNAWIRWLPKEKNQQPRRPKLKAGTTDSVWEEGFNHCAHCGLSAERILFLGLKKTVQHVPPFAVNGHEGYLIPLCSWCQEHSATTMTQLNSLIDRLCKKYSTE